MLEPVNFNNLLNNRLNRLSGSGYKVPPYKKLDNLLTRTGTVKNTKQVL
jgi:hypothetical protein